MQMLKASTDVLKGHKVHKKQVDIHLCYIAVLVFPVLVEIGNGFDRNPLMLT